MLIIIYTNAYRRGCMEYIKYIQKSSDQNMVCFDVIFFHQHKTASNFIFCLHFNKINMEFIALVEWIDWNWNLWHFISEHNLKQCSWNGIYWQL